MRLSSSYLLAFTAFQAGVTMTHRPPQVRQSIPEQVVWQLKTVFCIPTACNGMQAYEWVALPLAVLASVLFLTFPVIWASH